MIRVPQDARLPGNNYNTFGNRSFVVARTWILVGRGFRVTMLLLIKIRKLPAKMLYLGRIIDRDVGIVRMKRGVILVIRLG